MTTNSRDANQERGHTRDRTSSRSDEERACVVKARPRRLVPWALMLIVGYGCVSPSGTEIMLRMGYIVDDSDLVEPLMTIEASSDRVHVAITTLGNSCISKGRMAIAKDGAHVLVTPYDYVTVLYQGEPANCVRGIGGEHEATIRFDVPRPWTIEVRGLRQGISRDTVTFVRVIE